MKIKQIILLLAVTLSSGFLNISYSDISDKGGKEFVSGNNFYKKGDYKQAFYWYQQSAEQGNANAQYNLGNIYYDGKGVSKDYKHAYNWYQKSAEQGNASAQYSLGWMYANGEGVAEDDKQAVSWYRKSAEQGNAHAQLGLGMMYFTGYGISRDLNKALYWVKKSAKQGNYSADITLRIIKTHQDGEKLSQLFDIDYVLKEAQERAEFWDTVKDVAIVVGAAAVVATAAVVGKNMIDSAFEDTDDCLRPDGNCTSLQLRKHKTLLAKAKRAISNKLRDPCPNPSSAKAFLKSVFVDIGSHTLEAITVSLTGDPEHLIVDLNRFRNAINCQL